MDAREVFDKARYLRHGLMGGIAAAGSQAYGNVARALSNADLEKAEAEALAQAELFEARDRRITSLQIAMLIPHPNIAEALAAAGKVHNYLWPDAPQD